MFRKLLIVAAIFIPHRLVYTGNDQLSGFLPMNMIVSSMTNNAMPFTKKGWQSLQQCEDVDRLWNSGVRMIKISVQWYQPELSKTNEHTSLSVSDDKLKPYLALCSEKPANNNCPITKMRRAGKDPQSLQEFLKKLATLLQNHSQEVFILKINNHMYQRSVKNGATNYNETQILQMFKRELEISGLDRFVLPLAHRRQPLTIGEMRLNNRRLIIIDNHTSVRLSQYVSSNKDFTDQIDKGYGLMHDCLHIPTHSKNKFKNIKRFKSNKKIHEPMTIDGVKGCYVAHNVLPVIVNSIFSNVNDNDIKRILKNLKHPKKS